MIAAWKNNQTILAFAGQDSEEIDEGTFAWLEQKITDAEEYPELYSKKDMEEKPLFSAELDVDQDCFRLFSKGEWTVTDNILADGEASPLRYAAADNRLRLFVDMDGVLAKFKTVDTLETLYEKGYFLNLAPQDTVVEAVRCLAGDPQIEVYILSSVLSDSSYALAEKNAWLDEHLPEIDREHRIFPPCGEDKKMYIPEGIRQTDCLLDDYTHNLVLWEPPARGIKLLNGINHTKGTWQGAMVSHELTGEELYHEIREGVLDLPAKMKHEAEVMSYGEEDITPRRHKKI